MVKGIQTSNGKAFEYACVDAIYRRLSCDQEVVIEDTPQLRTAKEFFDRAPETLKDNIIKAADAASRVIIRLEPQLTFPEDNSPLFLSLQTDAMGQMGDVRDVLCIRKQNGWEIGFSCKHNHHAVKHSRLSGTIDFGKEWFDIPCSYEYFIEVRRLYNPPCALIKLSRIQEFALPQTITIRFFLWHPQEFQNPSKALMNSDLGVSSHGNSSMNTNWREPSSIRIRCFSRSRKASNQDLGLLHSSIP